LWRNSAKCNGKRIHQEMWHRWKHSWSYRWSLWETIPQRKYCFLSDHQIYQVIKFLYCGFSCSFFFFSFFVFYLPISVIFLPLHLLSGSFFVCGLARLLLHDVKVGVDLNFRKKFTFFSFYQNLNIWFRSFILRISVTVSSRFLSQNELFLSLRKDILRRIYPIQLKFSGFVVLSNFLF